MNATINEIQDKELVVETELFSSRSSNEKLEAEVTSLRISLDEEALKNVAKIAEIVEVHATEMSALKQEMDVIKTDKISEMVETHKSEVAVLKVTEQELLAQLDHVNTNSLNLQSKLEESNTEISSLMADKHSVQSKLDTSSAQLFALQEKLDKSLTSCKDLRLELEEVVKYKEDLEARLDTNITESENIQNLRVKLETSEKLVKELKNQLSAAETSNSDLQFQLESMMSSNQELQTKLDASLESVISSTVDLQSRLDSAQALNKELQLEIDAKSSMNQEQIKEINEKLVNAEHNCQELQVSLETSVKTRTDLLAQIDSVSNDYQVQLLDLQSKLESTEVHVQELQLKHTTSEERNKELETKLDKEQQLIKTLQSKLDNESSNNQGQFQELESKIESSEKLSRDLQSKLDFALTSNQEQVPALQQKLNSSESQMEIMNEIEEKLVDAESRNALLQEEQHMFKDKYSEVQRSLNCSKQEVEDLQRKVTELVNDNNILSISKDELQNEVSSLSIKAKELEVSNKNVKLSNSSLNENYLQVNENFKVLNEKFEESQKHIEGLKTKEADFAEAINSLKSINEMITKAARDSEAGKKDLELRFKNIEKEKNAMEASIREMENKNLELEGQVQLVGSQKKELEFCFVESQNSIAALKDEIKQLSAAKESRVEEEKDVDESEQTAIDKNMIQVLNEKIRENTQMKSENNYLLQNLTVEREAKEKLESELAECKQTYSSMNTETVKKLSMLVRDKDLEIESLSERNKSLLEIIENEKAGEKKEAALLEEMRRLKDESKEAELLEEIRKLKDENIKDKVSVDNSNELFCLKGRISELETKLKCAGKEKVDNNIESLNEDSSNQHEDVADRSLVLRLETKSLHLESVEKEAGILGQELAEVKSILTTKEEELVKLKEEANRSQVREGELQQEVDRVRRSLVSMQGLLEEKTTSNVSQQEQGLKYIGECERLSKELSQMTSERDTAVTQGKARLQEAQDLRREVSSIIEKKKRVEGEVERLRGHLVQVEEGYTVELMEGEEREKELRKRVAQLEDQVRVATHTSSEVSESASQASTQLTAALETAARQRDSLTDQLASCEATLRTRNMELRNLQLALEGFQRQKENEIVMAERNCEAKVAKEQRVVGELQEKLRLNKQQLDRAQQGLEAAARLSEQLDKKGVVITNLKQEISVREEMVKNMQEKLLALSSSQVGRVDRDLVKNLVVGYATADDAKKPEVLRIIATVLDFNSDERGRTGLDGGVGSWLGGLLGSRSRHPSTSQAPVEQNIAKAFIQFLEEESTVRPVVTLPVLEMARTKVDQLAGRAGKTPSPPLSASPTLALPSLGNTSHSPSILKSVLDEPEKEGSS